MSAPRGMSLLECLAGMVIAGVLTAAAGTLLLAGLRLARGEASALAVRRSVRSGAAVLRAELSAVSAEAGDLVSVSDSAITLRALRGLGVLCAAPAGARIVLDDALLSQWRAIDPSRDSVRLYVEGDPLAESDDRWVLADITSSARDSCTSGAGGTALWLGSLSAATLAAVRAGAPVRIYEEVQYRRYRDASGQWMLGVRSPLAGGGWSPTSPVAGPVQAVRGVEFLALDSAGGPAATPGEAVVVEFVLRGVAAAALPNGARPSDSLRAVTLVRGPVR